jgi:rhodanese-related sulfurtransferase
MPQDASAIARHLAEVRAGISVIDPARAAELRAAGALMVDTRPVAQRRQFGEMPGALVVDRNVLEWRLDPTSPNRLDVVHGADQPIVVFCQEGYSSSLAVASLAGLGLTNVHDLAGGFGAWADAGLPTVPGGSG